MQKSIMFVKKSLIINIWHIKNIVKLEMIAIIQGNIEVLCIAYVIWNIAYLKNYDYHFIISELAEKFKNQFTCQGENTEKYITFTAPTEKRS